MSEGVPDRYCVFNLENYLKLCEYLNVKGDLDRKPRQKGRQRLYRHHAEIDILLLPQTERMQEEKASPEIAHTQFQNMAQAFRKFLSPHTLLSLPCRGV